MAADLCLILSTLVLTCRHVRQTLRLARSANWRPIFVGGILLNAVHCLLLYGGIRRRLVAHKSILHVATIVMQGVGAAAVVLNLSCLAQLLLRLRMRIVLHLLLVVLRLCQKGEVLRTQHVVTALILACLIRCATRCFVLLVNALELRIQ